MSEQRGEVVEFFHPRVSEEGIPEEGSRIRVLKDA